MYLTLTLTGYFARLTEVDELAQASFSFCINYHLPSIPGPILPFVSNFFGGSFAEATPCILLQTRSGVAVTGDP